MRARGRGRGRGPGTGVTDATRVPARYLASCVETTPRAEGPLPRIFRIRGWFPRRQWS